MHKKITYILTLAIVVVLLAPVGVFAAAGQPQLFNLTIIHTNDFHDYEPYALARKATIIKQIRAEKKNVLLLDGGDLSIRGPYHKVFYGELEMAVLNALKYDAWELGNNEFKAHPDQAVTDEKLSNLINQAKFPTLCSNVKTPDGDYLPGVQPYIVKQVADMKIGILGVTSNKVKKYPQAANKVVEDAFTAVKNLIPEVRKESDIQIVLSHAGLAGDLQIDRDLADSGISFILGADDHFVIPQPIYRSGGIPITQAGGEDNIFLGRLDLTYEKKDGKWLLKSHKGMLYPINDKVPMDAEIKKIVDGYLSKVKKTAA
jgi:2',3'-cyclic-nucleotide 2'-phosphodiesterase (5'-nucleotidase family)